MTLPGADTMKAGAIGDEALRGMVFVYYRGDWRGSAEERKLEDDGGTEEVEGVESRQWEWRLQTSRG